MDSYEIYKKANNLIQKYGTNDPIELADALGIWVYDVAELGNLLGMYTYKWKHPIILMNPNSNEHLYTMAMGHEVSHHVCHHPLVMAGFTFQEFELFNMTSMTEYEANACNSHFLINEHEMVELFKDGYDLAATSSILKVNINLMLIKIQEMNKLGMDLRLPFDPDPRFLRNTRY
jgi:Zn-dependent peptidase ImmA (M78 family)